MKYDVVGSFLPPDSLVAAREALDASKITNEEYKKIEDEAVATLVDRELEIGLNPVSSGEYRRRYWDRDFYFGLGGISCERVDGGRIYQDFDSFTDVMRITGRISYNPEHPLFRDFAFLREYVAGRADLLQTIPSPTELYLRIITDTAISYPNPETLIADIADTYRQIIRRFYDEGCRYIQLDDTVCGRICNDNFTKGLIQGGIDIMKIENDIVELINSAIANIPEDLSISLYLSSGPTVIPEWNTALTPDNIMPRVLANANVNLFILPFDQYKPEQAEMMKFIPQGKHVALGLIDAHSPFPDKTLVIRHFVELVRFKYPQLNLSLAPRTGFKLTSYAERGLTFEDQWHKISELDKLSKSL